MPIERLKMRRVVYEPVDVDRDQLMTVAEAGKVLGMSLAGIIRAIERGALSEFVDEGAGYHRRRLLLRREVEQFNADRSK